MKGYYKTEQKSPPHPSLAGQGAERAGAEEERLMKNKWKSSICGEISIDHIIQKIVCLEAWSLQSGRLGSLSCSCTYQLCHAGQVSHLNPGYKIGVIITYHSSQSTSDHILLLRTLWGRLIIFLPYLHLPLTLWCHLLLPSSNSLHTEPHLSPCCQKYPVWYMWNLGKW